MTWNHNEIITEVVAKVTGHHNKRKYGLEVLIPLGIAASVLLRASKVGSQKVFKLGCWLFGSYPL